MRRERSGRRIELSARDLELFRLLVRYRYLRSTYLHAFVGGASGTRFKERLGDLFHEGYLDRPEQQWEFADARYRPVVHEIGGRGRRALRENSEQIEGATFLSVNAHRQYRHSLMLCEAMASLELACRGSDLRFISWPEILAKAPQATRASPAPWRLHLPSGTYIVPDGLFGIEYTRDGRNSYRFFAIEADRGTMPAVRSRGGQTSYMAKLAAYQAAIRSGAHRACWGIPNLLVLTLSTHAANLEQMVRRGAALGPAFLFKATEERSLLRPAAELLVEPWRRAALPPLSIAEAG